MSTTPFEDLFPNLPRIDREWEARKKWLMALTADERIVAMRAGQLSYRELCHWSAVRPDEVPRLSTGEGGAGEFEWLVAFMPEIAEARDTPHPPLRLDSESAADGERIPRGRALDHAMTTGDISTYSGLRLLPAVLVLLDVDNDPAADRAVNVVPAERRGATSTRIEDEVTIDWTRLQNPRRSANATRLAAIAHDAGDFLRRLGGDKG